MSLQVEVQEALCSALYQMPFAEFLGEQDRREGRVAYFHLGEHPKDMRVSITRPADKEEVVVYLQWRNYAGNAREPLMGSQTIRVSTYAATQAMLQQPTTDVVVRILEVYRDVLEETGVAGNIADLAEPAEEVEE